MAVASATAEKIEPPQPTDQSPSTRFSDAASDSSSGGPSSTADPSDHPPLDPPISFPSPSTQLEHQPSLRSEEYRQLFRLLPEEVLIRDFNCALQENFLLQGHMYLFVHYICFYSNLFGFETKKIIAFQEVTSVRRAKTAGIFPTALEIIAAGKKYFFTSFLSRDEAFKLISDGWLQHGNGAKAITEQQESTSDLNIQETGSVEQAKSSIQPLDDLDFTERDKDVSMTEDSELPPNGEAEVVSTIGVQDNVEEDTEVVLNTDCSSSGKPLAWELKDSDAPEVPECYTMVAESKFAIKVEEFFNLFFSDAAVNFHESFHNKCGDKDFRCTSWYPHDDFAYARDVSFQHPIKLYFGARFGSCQEIQKYRVYRNSYLVIDTSQEINDVPYGDYFRVEGRWDLERDGDESKECCILRVYTNVAFLKKTMWKGKIVQSTVEECRDAYAIWIDLAHELLKQKNLEKEKAGSPAANAISNGQVHPEMQPKTGERSERSNEKSDLRMSETLPDSTEINQVRVPLQGSLSGAASVASSFRDSVGKFCLSLKSQSQVPSFAVIVVAVILLLMQISILVLLARPQQIQVMPQADCRSSMHRGAETVALLDKQINHLKEEMLMVETLLEKMRHEHALLAVQLKDLMFLRKQQS